MESKLLIAYIGNSSAVTSRLAAHEKFRLEILPNALSAINYMKSGQKPDAILCESNVSGGSAFEIFDTLQSNHYLHHIAFILIAFEFRNEIFQEAFKLRIDDYYVLPDPEPDALYGRITFLKEYKNNFESRSEPVLPPTIQKLPASKRLFDIVVASSALLFLSPLLLAVIVAIRLESRGKFYYTSKRYGRFPFDFYKLRSMRSGTDVLIDKLAKEKNQYSNADKPTEIIYSFDCPRCKMLPEGQTCSPVIKKNDQAICEFWNETQQILIQKIKGTNKVDYDIPCPKCEFLQKPCSTILKSDKPDICNDFKNFQDKVIAQSKATYNKISNDPRVTRVGKFIRNTSIDELPQLFNVLKGDMSIVGNRPLPLNEAERLLKDSNSKRFLAPAGITGLWQVELRGKGGVMSEEERNRLDNEYADLFINNTYTFWYDLKLVLRTFRALFQKDSV